MRSLSVVLGVTAVAMALGLGACGDEGASGTPSDKGARAQPTEGKADGPGGVVMRGALAFDAPAAGTFTGDLEFHGYTLEVRPGALVDLEITQKGSSRALDSTLFVFGPRRADGTWGAQALAFDDDSGWGALSRLRGLRLEEGGSWLVVVGTFNGRGRGDYRLLATCGEGSGACTPEPVVVEPEGACHPELVAAIEACVQGWREDGDFDPATTGVEDLVTQCADAEPVAPAWDALCAAPEAPAAACDVAFEEFAQSGLLVCRQEALDAALDTTCVFGARYRDLFDGPDHGALVILQADVLRASDALTALDEAQLVEAVHRTAHDDVTTAAEAFAAVDEGIAHRTHLWDASNRRAYTAWEVGAGDNSFGAIFDHGATTVAASIQDGDLVGCATTWGPERRPCTDDAACAEGLRCLGASEVSPRGRCLDTGLDDVPGLGDACDAAAPCALGLVCGGGLCQPGWMRGHFSSEPALEIPDADSGGVEAQLLVHGLATVSTEVTLDLVIAHPRTSDLRVSLINPAGTEVVVFAGEHDGPELALDDLPIIGFPGDESANGVWRLKVADTRSGQRGAIGRLSLTVTSRWD